MTRPHEPHRSNVNVRGARVPSIPSGVTWSTGSETGSPHRTHGSPLIVLLAVAANYVRRSAITDRRYMPQFDDAVRGNYKARQRAEGAILGHDYRAIAGSLAPTRFAICPRTSSLIWRLRSKCSAVRLWLTLMHLDVIVRVSS